MRSKYAKNRDFPLMLGSDKKPSAILESLSKNYQQEVILQTSGTSKRGSLKFEDFLNADET